MKSIELIKKLQKINKPFYTISDLEKITLLPRNSLYVSLKRGVTEGIIERVAQGIYVPIGSTLSVETTSLITYPLNLRYRSMEF